MIQTPEERRAGELSACGRAIRKFIEFSIDSRANCTRAGKDRQRNWGCKAGGRVGEGGVGKCSRHRSGDDVAFCVVHPLHFAIVRSDLQMS
jgi:hypothetical protein